MDDEAGPRTPNSSQEKDVKLFANTRSTFLVNK